MDSKTEFEAALSPYHPQWLDGSKRGSGMNATWRIRVGGSSIVLKTYDSRRSPLQSILTEIANSVTGLTSYAPENRCGTERECLRLWREAGFQVPALVGFKPAIPLPTPFVAMEEIQGKLLIDVLADNAIDREQRVSILRRFAREWGLRHAEAIRRRDHRLVQKHGSFAHVFVAGDRLVTFDLEVAYRSTRDISRCVGREIICYLRSLGQRFPAEAGDEWIRIVAETYPDRTLLVKASADLLHGDGPFHRLFHLMARLIPGSRRPGGKYGVALRLAAILRSVA